MENKSITEKFQVFIPGSNLIEKNIYPSVLKKVSIILNIFLDKVFEVESA